MNEPNNKNPQPKRPLAQSGGELGKFLENLNREPASPFGISGKNKNKPKASHNLSLQKPNAFQPQAKKMTGKARGNRGR